VTAYLAALGQPARTDSSNADRRFTRNRIRHDLLPLLKDFNGEIVPILNRLAVHAAEAFDFIERAAAALLAKAERPRAGEMLILDRPTLDAAEPFLVRELFRLVWRREGWPLDAMTHAHWNRLADLAVGDYPSGVRLRLAGKVVQLERKTGFTAETAKTAERKPEKSS
jgi:tRNA(Ile)-lysidine synthase